MSLLIAAAGKAPSAETHIERHAFGDTQRNTKYQHQPICHQQCVREQHPQPHAIHHTHRKRVSQRIPHFEYQCDCVHYQNPFSDQLHQ